MPYREGRFPSLSTTLREAYEARIEAIHAQFLGDDAKRDEFTLKGLTLMGKAEAIRAQRRASEANQGEGR
jgi:hypothetical protein